MIEKPPKTQGPADTSMPKDSIDYSLTETMNTGWGMTILTETPGRSLHVYFQFPPKITQESNSSRWQEEDVWAIEPLKIHRGSTGRSLNMQWEYIATGKGWGPQRINDNLMVLKSYFFEWDEKTYPIVMFQYTNIIQTPTKFRLMNCNIDYSPEIIKGEYGLYFPLHTKVSVTLELATNLNTIRGRANANVEEAKAKIPKKPLEAAKPEWY